MRNVFRLGWSRAAVVILVCLDNGRPVGVGGRFAVDLPMLNYVDWDERVTVPHKPLA